MSLIYKKAPYIRKGQVGLTADNVSLGKDVIDSSLTGGGKGNSAVTPGKTGGGVAAAGAVAGMVGGFVDTLGDDGDENYTGGEIAADIGGAALKGAAAGAAFGPVGMAAGAVIGGAMGVFKSVKAAKAAEELKFANEKKRDTEKMGKGRDAAAERGASLASGAMLYDNQLGSDNSGYAMAARNGLILIIPKLHTNIPKSNVFDNSLTLIPIKKRIFKKGGKIKPTENIIPNGVLHEENNELGDKGMPVVKCDMAKNSCTKHYEIERDEMIFTHKSTTAVEEMAKGGELRELGKFVKDQILSNTHSFTDRYDYLNNNNKDETIFA